MPAKIHGKVESILLARASSSAAALKGSGKSCFNKDVFIGAPGWTWPPLLSSTLLMRCGDKRGDEKDNKYRAMKNSSLSAQATNSTVCELVCQYVSLDNKPMAK